VSGSGLEPRAFVAELERLGDSVLVVGDAQTLKVHVHTDDPAGAQTLFAAVGVVSHVDVFDMRRQADARAARRRRS
jgi:dihydroxyacetone kinase-like predicted kinase